MVRLYDIMALPHHQFGTIEYYYSLKDSERAQYSVCEAVSRFTVHGFETVKRKHQKKNVCEKITISVSRLHMQ